MEVMLNNPLMNFYTCLKKNRSTSRPLPAKKRKYKKINLISQMYQTMRKTRLASRDKATTEVENHAIDDRFGDEPMQYEYNNIE